MSDGQTVAEIRIVLADDHNVLREYTGAAQSCGGASLVFENDNVMRRVREFPAHWHELPDEELFQLSWRR